MREFRAVVWTKSEDGPVERVKVMAEDIDDAVAQVKRLFGRYAEFSLWGDAEGAVPSPGE